MGAPAAPVSPAMTVSSTSLSSSPERSSSRPPAPDGRQSERAALAPCASASRNLQPCQCSSTRPSVTWPAGTFGSISLGTNSPPTILLVEIRILFFVNAATQDVFSTATATVEIACCVIPASSTPGGGPGRADEGLQTFSGDPRGRCCAGRPSGRESGRAPRVRLARTCA